MSIAEAKANATAAKNIFKIIYLKGKLNNKFAHYSNWLDYFSSHFSCTLN